MIDSYVWVTDKITGHSYPIHETIAGQDPSRYERKPGHPVRDSNGRLLAPKYRNTLKKLKETSPKPRKE